jgi:hypothetical protein
MRRVAVVMAGLMWATAVSADASRESEKEAARVHYQRGVAEYELEHYEKALSEFEAGFTAMPEAAFLFNLAIVHNKLGHKAEALKFYRKYFDRGVPEAEEASLRETIARLERELAAPVPKPAEPPPPLHVDPPVLVITAPPAPPPPKKRVWPIAVGVTAGVVVVAVAVGLAVGLSAAPSERVLDWSAR